MAKNEKPGVLSGAPTPAPTRDAAARDGLTVEQKRAKIAELQAEIDALSAPEPVEYPKVVHHTSGDSKVVQSREEEDALGDGWADAAKPKVETDDEKKAKADAKLKAEAKVKAEADAKAKLAAGTL
jgi:colicin import membrane protein